MRSVTNFAIDLLAAYVAGNTQTFFATTDLELRLVTTDFTPDPSLGVGDLSYASGDGLSPKVAPATAPTVEWDPDMGVWGIRVWWTGGNVFTNSAVGAPPVVGYGWAVVNIGDTELVMTGKFDEPITFDHVGIGAHVPEVLAWFAAPFLGDKPEVA